jgi:aspartate/methionine/tyrosine aminotransferase
VILVAAVGGGKKEKKMPQGATTNKLDLEAIAASVPMGAPAAFQAAVAVMLADWPQIVGQDQQLLRQRAMEAARELMEQLPCHQTRGVFEAAMAWLLAEPVVPPPEE